MFEDSGHTVKRDDKEFDARSSATRFLLNQGSRAWVYGDTRLAFGNFEAAGMPSSEFVDKAKKLLEADKIFQEWKRVANSIENAAGGHTKGHSESVSERERAICGACDVLELINEKAAFEIIKVLGWEMPMVNEMRIMISRTLNVSDAFYQNAATAAYRAAARKH